MESKDVKKIWKRLQESDFSSTLSVGDEILRDSRKFAEEGGILLELQRKNMDLEREIVFLKQELEKLQSEQKSHRDLTDQENTRNQEKIKWLQEEKETLLRTSKENIQKLEATLEQERLDHAKVLEGERFSQAEVLAAQKSQAGEEYRRLQEAQREQLERSKRKVQGLEEILDRERREWQERLKAVASDQRETLDLEISTALERQKAEMEDLKRKVVHLEKRLQDERHSFEKRMETQRQNSLSENQAERQRELNDLRSKTQSDLEAQKQTYEEEIKTLQLTGDQRVNDLNEAHKKNTNELKSRLESESQQAREDLERLEKTHLEEKRSLEAEIGRWKEESDRLQELLRSHQDHWKELDQRMESLSQIVHNLSAGTPLSEKPTDEGGLDDKTLDKIHQETISIRDALLQEIKVLREQQERLSETSAKNISGHLSQVVSSLETQRQEAGSSKWNLWAASAKIWLKGPAQTWIKSPVGILTLVLVFSVSSGAYLKAHLQNRPASFSSPAANLGGVLASGDQFWISDWMNGQLFRVDPEDPSKILFSGQADTDEHPISLRMAKDKLWAIDPWSAQVPQHSPQMPYARIKSFPCAAKVAGDFAWDGSVFWVLDRSSQSLLEFPSNNFSKPQRVVSLPANWQLVALDFWKGDFWGYDTAAGRLRRFQVDQSVRPRKEYRLAVHEQAISPLSGLAVSDEYVWTLSEKSQKIYRWSRWSLDLQHLFTDLFF